MDAVATADLFNFVGDSLVRTWSECRARRVAVADRGTQEIDAVEGSMKDQRQADSVFHLARTRRTIRYL